MDYNIDITEEELKSLGVILSNKEEKAAPLDEYDYGNIPEWVKSPNKHEDYNIPKWVKRPIISEEDGNIYKSWVKSMFKKWRLNK